jgi:hypothetical protein
VFKNSFENFNNYKDTMPSWIKAKEDAKAYFDAGNKNLIASTHTEDFFRRFLVGNVNVKGEQLGGGLSEALEKAGFVYVPRDSEDTITNFIGDAINWLDKDIVN